MATSRPGLLALLHRANQIATDQFSVALGKGTITARQVQVLAAIEANEGASQTRIVELTGIDRSTLADMIRRLQKNRLIERRRSKVDARAYVLKLTDSGARTLNSSKPAMTSAEQRLLASLSNKGQSDLMNLLEKVVEHGANSQKR